MKGNFGVISVMFPSLMLGGMAENPKNKFLKSKFEGIDGFDLDLFDEVLETQPNNGTHYEMKTKSNWNHVRSEFLPSAEPDSEHTGYRTIYQCVHCPLQFDEIDNFNRHKVTHLEQNQLSCKYCKCKFSSVMCLTRHETSHRAENCKSREYCHRMKNDKAGHGNKRVSMQQDQSQTMLRRLDKQYNNVLREMFKLRSIMRRNSNTYNTANAKSKWIVTDCAYDSTNRNTLPSDAYPEENLPAGNEIRLSLGEVEEDTLSDTVVPEQPACSSGEQISPKNNIIKETDENLLQRLNTNESSVQITQKSSENYTITRPLTTNRSQPSEERIQQRNDSIDESVFNLRNQSRAVEFSKQDSRQASDVSKDLLGTTVKIQSFVPSSSDNEERSDQSENDFTADGFADSQDAISSGPKVPSSSLRHVGHAFEFSGDLLDTKEDIQYFIPSLSDDQDLVDERSTQSGNIGSAIGSTALSLHADAQCPFCDRSFAIRKSLRMHMTAAHPGEEKTVIPDLLEDQYACNFCQKVVQYKCRIVEHLRTHTGERPYKCQICEASFIRRGALNEHLKIHSRDVNNQCPTFKYRKRGSKTHLMKTKLDEKNKVITDTANSQLECKICHKMLQRKFHLKEHLRVHSGERPFFCGICKATFTARKSLQRHLSIHTRNENRHQCPWCELPFSNLKCLKRHVMAAHPDEGEKIIKYDIASGRFECDICHKRFQWKNHMKEHLRIHTGERPFQCEICKLGFKQRGALNVHLKIHRASQQCLGDS